jgi:hypothetical protein
VQGARRRAERRAPVTRPSPPLSLTDALLEGARFAASELTAQLIEPEWTRGSSWQSFRTRTTPSKRPPRAALDPS